MTEQQAGIQLDRAVDSLTVGKRHRTDLGDIETLAASIDRDGLLQPLTITIDGVLVCGARRLAAIKMLGWRTVSVWVRGGLSDRLGKLLAEQEPEQDASTAAGGYVGRVRVPCLLYTSPSPRDRTRSRMPSSA